MEQLYREHTRGDGVCDLMPEFRVWVKILLLRSNSLPITMTVITFSILRGFTKASKSTEKEPV